MISLILRLNLAHVQNKLNEAIFYLLMFNKIWFLHNFTNREPDKNHNQGIKSL